MTYWGPEVYEVSAKSSEKLSKWKFFRFFPLRNFFFFFAELQELEHSAEGTFFRKIGNFSTFSTNSKIPKIYLSGPITVQSFSKKYFLKKVAPKQGDFEQKFPIFKLKFGFYRKIFRFSTFFKICKK